MAFTQLLTENKKKTLDNAIIICLIYRLIEASTRVFEKSQS